MRIRRLKNKTEKLFMMNSRKRRCRTAKKAASEENLWRRRLKNKTKKLPLKRI